MVMKSQIDWASPEQSIFIAISDFSSWFPLTKWKIYIFIIIILQRKVKEKKNNLKIAKNHFNLKKKMLKKQKNSDKQKV